MMKNRTHLKSAYIAFAAAAAAMALVFPMTEPANAAVPAGCPDGVVSYWTFDAGDAADDSDANHGTVHGATAAQGRSGQGFYFDGEDDYIEVPDSPNLDPEPTHGYVEMPHSPNLDPELAHDYVEVAHSADLNPEPTHAYVEVPHSTSLDLAAGQFTLEAWIRPRATAGDYRAIIAKMGWTDTGRWSYYLAVTDRGALYAAFVNGHGAHFPLSSRDGSIKTGVWQHVAATYDGAVLRLYIDGVEAASREADGSPRQNDYPLSIGRWTNGDSNQFAGAIDDAAVYGAALSAEEVQSHYLAGPAGYCDGGCPAGMVGYWRFDEGAGTAAADAIGGNDGTIHGAAWTAGMAGSALDLSGNEFTLEAWIKPRAVNGDYRSIIAKMGWDDTSRWSYHLAVTDRGGLHVNFANEHGWSFALSSREASIQAGVWQHVAATYDGGILRLYIDGVEAASREAGGGPRQNDYPVSIGRWYAGDPNQFAGAIDDAAVYGAALSAEELRSHHLAGPAGYCDGGCPAGMVSYWRFDEGAGTAAADAIGGNDGTIHGAAWTAGMAGSALDFSGNEFTLEAWINPRATNGDYRSIIAKMGWDDTSRWSYHLAVTDRGGLHANFANEHGWSFALSSREASIQAGVWQHVAATYDGAILRLYIDGVEAASREAGGGPRQNDYPVSIGRWTSGDPNQFAGAIDDAAVYNAVLSADEIQSHYLAGPAGYCDGGCPAGMVSYWRFDEGAGAAVSDSVGGNDGTIHGAVWTDGMAGSALDFSGNGFTLEAWIKPTEIIGDWRTIIAKMGWEDTSRWSYTLQVTYHGALYASFANEHGWGFSLYSPNGSLGTGIWQHVAAAYDGGLLRLYIDGAEVASREAGGAPRQNDYPLSIGRWYSEDPNPFAGAIDEAAVYDATLSPEEIQDHYIAGLADKGYCWTCGTAADCDDQNPCTSDICADGLCSHDAAAMDGAQCDDGSSCTAGDVCDDASCAGAPAPDAEGMAGYWTFDAGDATDDFGDNDGIVQGATPAQGKTGLGFDLDGQDDHIEVPPSPELNLDGPEAMPEHVEVPHSTALNPKPSYEYVEVAHSADLNLEPTHEYVEVPFAPSLDLDEGQFTLESWINPRAAYGDYRTIMAKIGWTDTGRWSYNLQVTDRGALYAAFVNDQGAHFPLSSEEGSIQAGVWQHVAATYDGATLRLYIDGAEAASRDADGVPRQNPYPLSIGRWTKGDANQLAGAIDAAAVYDAALTAEELQSHYLAGPAGYCDGGCPAGMVSYWRFDEGTGAAATDSIGGNHGAIHGAAWTDGVAGNALDFSGNEFSLEAWINPKATYGDYRTIIAKMGWDDTSRWSYHLAVADRGGLHANFANEHGWSFGLSSPDGSLQAGVWQHVAATYDGGLLRLYIDGIEVASREAGGAPRRNDYPVSFGRWYSGDPNQFAGAIDDAAVYDAALTPEEIQSHHLAGAAGYCDGGCPAGMVSYWRFDEGAGAAVSDSVGGNHGVIHGAAWADGMAGGALDFSGNEFSLEAWINPSATYGDYKTIITKTAWDDTSRWSYNLQVTDRGGLHANFVNEHGWSFALSSPNGSLATGVWQHVAATYDGGILRLYIDGAEAASREAGGGPRRNDYPVSMGRWYAGDPNHFTGAIDEAAVYGAALTPEEVQSHHLAGAAGYCEGGCPAGMVSYWRFDEGAGTAVSDSIGGNHGTIHGPEWTAGMAGSALDFSGNGFTLEAWINPSAITGDWRAVIAKTGWDDTSRWSYNLQVTYHGALHSTFVNEHGWGFSLYSPNDSIQTGIWQHVAAAYDGAMLRLYIDGAEVASREAGGVLRRNAYPLSIGRWYSPDPNPFAGGIDEVAVYERALTPAEIQAHYGSAGGSHCEDSASCADADGDDYGAAGTDTSACPNAGYDCDDGDPSVIPGAVIETDVFGYDNVGECRTRKEECDGATGAFESIQTAVGPSAEACDGLDNDCDGSTDEGFQDFDGDGTADCVDPDDDDDGLPDAGDACPFEHPQGADADADGCIDRLEDAPEVVQELDLPAGTSNELESKLDGAIAAQEDGNTGAATNKLKALINSVKAQRGKKISEEDADLLIDFANNAINGME
ncbi:MAG: LamG-like jellyroll fold domain-containing protein [Elusimicrobiota bacterium]